MNAQSIFGKKFLFLTAHPDDESFAAAGTVYKNYLAGGSSVIVCATLGERGTSHLLRPLSVRQVKALRRKELERAAKFLHVKKLHLLGLPDGSVNKFKAQLFGKLLRIARNYRPDVIFSFDKDGISGHLDHIAVSLVAAQVAKKLKVPFCCFCVPPEIAAKAPGFLGERRKYGKYIALDKIRHAQPNLKIKINSTTKAKTIRFHVSQLDEGAIFDSLPGKLRTESLKYENFRLYG